MHNLAKGALAQDGSVMLQKYSSKLTRPVYKKILKRKRLFNEVESLFSSAPILWISAPAGSGKTTLVSSYIEHKKSPCLWYRIDERDNELSSFFYHIGLAVKTNFRLKTELPTLTNEYGLHTFVLNYFEELYSLLKKTTIIVFDDFHTVTDDLFHDSLLRSFSVIPQWLKIIVISRTHAPSAYSSLKVSGMLNSLYWENVFFTLEETKELVNLGVRGVVTEDNFRVLHNVTRGWASGIVLLLRG